MLEIAPCPSCHCWLLLPSTPANRPGQLVGFRCPACQIEVSIDELEQHVQTVHSLERQPATDEPRAGVQVDDDRITPLEDEIPSPFVTGEPGREVETESTRLLEHSPDSDSTADHVNITAHSASVDDADESKQEEHHVTRARSKEASIALSTDAPQIHVGPGQPARGRAQKNVAWEMVKVVMGGIAGLAIAQLILWWAPGNVRRDPFGVAEHVPPWAQVVLPMELRQTPDVDEQRALWNAPPGTPLGSLLESNQPPVANQPPATSKAQPSSSESPRDPFADEPTE